MCHGNILMNNTSIGIELAKRHEERDYHIAKQMERVGVSSPDSDDGRRMRIMSDKVLLSRL